MDRAGKRYVTAEELADRLGARKLGESQWTARCPAHEDRTPSLSITRGNGGKAVVFCHADCPWDAVLRAAGYEIGVGAAPTPTARYIYRDENGVERYEIVRSEAKRFYARRPDGTPGITGVRRVLYRLPELRAAVERGDWVLVPEGEKDVETAVGLGFAATTAPFGAGKWRESYAESLRSARVVIVPDQGTEAEWEHAHDIARSVMGVAAEVRWMPLPGGLDLTDWVEAGGTAEELSRLVEEAAIYEPRAPREGRSTPGDDVLPGEGTSARPVDRPTTSAPRANRSGLAPTPDAARAMEASLKLIGDLKVFSRPGPDGAVAVSRRELNRFLRAQGIGSVAGEWLDLGWIVPTETGERAHRIHKQGRRYVRCYVISPAVMARAKTSPGAAESRTACDCS